MTKIRCTDKSGRGYNYTDSLSHFTDTFSQDDDVENYDGEWLSDWILEDHEDGDTFENHAIKYEIIKP